MSLIRAEKERCDIGSFSKVTTNTALSLWPREQALWSQINSVRANLQVNVDPGQALVFFCVKISCIVFPASARLYIRELA